MAESFLVVILTFSVVVLGLSQVQLYRLLAQRTAPAGMTTVPERWPLEVRAGDTLPESFAAQLPSGWRGLVLICSEERDEYYAFAAAQAVSGEWQAALSLALRATGRATRWEHRVPESVRAESRTIVSHALDALGVTTTPVLLAVADRRLLDATTDVHSPSVIAERFGYLTSALRTQETRTPMPISVSRE